MTKAEGTSGDGRAPPAIRAAPGCSPPLRGPAPGGLLYSCAACGARLRSAAVGDVPCPRCGGRAEAIEP